MRASAEVRHRARPRAAQLVLVANSHASSVRPELVADVEAELARWGAGVETLVTESAGEWVGALADDERRIVLLGGDGTLHAAVNATEARPELALVPAGRANNVARSLGIPLATAAAVRLAAEGRVDPVDLVLAETAARRYLTVEALSLGFLGEARTHYHGDNSGHWASGLAAGLHALVEFRPLHVLIEVPSGVHELTVAQLFVANLPLYGFGLHVAPEADPADELLDVVAIDAHGRAAIPPMLGRLARGRRLDAPDVHRWRVARVRISADRRATAIADSADLGPVPVEAVVAPKRLRLVRP